MSGSFLEESFEAQGFLTNAVGVGSCPHDRPSVGRRPRCSRCSADSVAGLRPLRGLDRSTADNYQPNPRRPDTDLSALPFPWS